MPHRVWSVFALLSMLMVSGCTVGPDYKRPNLKVPASFSASPVTNQPVIWWQSFGDPELASLVERAATANPDVQIAAARIRESRSSYGVAAAGAYPSVDFDGGYTKTRISNNGIFPPAFFGNPYDVYQIGFDAKWEIDIFGGVRRSIEAAEADIGTTIEDRHDMIVSVTAEVARDYIALRAYQRQIAIAQENLRSQNETLDVTDAKYKAGLRGQNTPSFAVNVDRQKAQVASTESTIPALEINIRQTIHRIGVLLGQDPESLAAELLPPRPIPMVPQPKIPLGLPSDLLRRRADIRRAERQLAAATARIGAATSDLYPRFSITGSFGTNSKDVRHLVDWASRAWTIGPAVSWNIFDAGSIRSNIGVQNARTEEALGTYKKTVLTGLQEVEDALIAFNKEQVRREALGRAVEASKRAVDLSNELYRGGLGDFLSVLDAERDLFTNQDQLAQSEQNVSADLVALYKALGGGWDGLEQITSPQPPPPTTQPANQVETRPATMPVP